MKPVLASLFVFLGASAYAFEPVIEREPTLYSETEPSTPLTNLAKRIESGEALLGSGSDRDLLCELLDLLEIPVESQVLVYSKTSAQNSRITPRTPRAIYFSDNAYVGWVQGGNIEVITFDERLGAVFHMVHLIGRREGEAPKIARDRSCLNCHAGSATSGFPGPLVRSVFPGEDGQPIFHAGTFRTDDSSPISERWGGWYVTGSSGQQEHMGNMLAFEDGRDVSVEKIVSEPVEDLGVFIPGEPYPAGATSDIVALMVFEHQVKAHNTLVEANITARQTLHRDAQMKQVLGEPAGDPLSETNRRILANLADEIAGVLLFKDEFAMVDDGVEGSLAFQEAFQANARKDSNHDSFKDLRLYERVFKHRCSYTIYSDVFRHLPDVLEQQVLQRLRAILTDPHSSPEFAYLAASERERILNILEDTLPGW